MRKSNYGKRPPMSKKTKKIMAGVIGVGILAALIVFFSYYKVDSVEVRGTDHYTDEEVKSMVLGDRWLRTRSLHRWFTAQQIRMILHTWMDLRLRS